MAEWNSGKHRAACCHVKTLQQQYFPLVSNYLIYYFSPVFGFFLSLLV
jgi:hypothetical protein